ncbi:MAG: nucleotidyltransferase domain-containing protein [Spirochaetaceae bacterium]|nr:nucleotidyltransferase domain-containing protein [Spirochaetaceae bacterium]
MNRTINLPGLDEALEEIRLDYDVYSVRVFGSVARAGIEVAQDVDVCILLNSRSQRILDITRHMRQILFRAVNRPIDLLVYDKTNFEDRENAGASFERTIAREGVPL